MRSFYTYNMNQKAGALSSKTTFARVKFQVNLSQPLEHYLCRNPSFGLATKAKGLQGCGPRGSPGVTSETPGSVGECEGVSLHTPKAIPTLGEGVPVDSRNFRDRFEGSKLNFLWCFLYHWKALGTLMPEMGSHCSFEHLKHKLWPKERAGSRIASLTPDQKKSRIDQIYLATDNVPHTIGKLSMKATTLL